MDKILLIDGNSFFYRSYYASQMIPDYYTHNSSKAVYTAIKMLRRFLVNQKDYYCIFVAFDLGKKTIRHQQFDDYKKTRKKTPDDLIEQIPLFEEFLTLMKIDFLKNDLYEADDLIASLCQMILNKNFAVDIFSNDYDLLQLIEINVQLFFPKQGATKMELINNQNFFAKFHLKPSQVVDFKALSGDSSDNLPGVKGIGPKIALNLLDEYLTLEGIYQNLHKLKTGVVKKLVDFKDDAFFTKRMVEIKKDISLNPILVKKDYDFNSASLQQFYKKHGMKSLLKNYKQKHFPY